PPARSTPASCLRMTMRRVSETPAKIKKGAPVLGEDNDFFYDEILVVDKAEQQELHDRGVI
ncbi:MAG: hypothetical protein OXH22_11160, partial [Chloroflexi bacterium]|nr:hypothetical protein [Chloroflexota bacterium]